MAEMAQNVQALNRVFSGRKSAILVRSIVAVTEAMTDADLEKFITSKNPRFSVLYNVSDKELVYKKMAGITDDEVIGEIKLAPREALLQVSTSETAGVGKWLKVTDRIGAIAKNEKGEYVFDFIIPNATSIDFTNESTIDSWNAFGNVYSNKMPTIMNWTASCGAKLDLGASRAQQYLYESMLNQRRLEVFFYVGINFYRNEDGTIKDGTPVVDKKKSTVWYGHAYISNFSTTAAPDTVADLSLDFDGDGELKAIFMGEDIRTNWAELLGE